MRNDALARSASADGMSRFSRYPGEQMVVAPHWCEALIVPPAVLFGANGIRINSDGRVWVAEHVGGSISAWDPDSGDIDLIEPAGRLCGPDDLVIGTDGTLFITEYATAEVVAIRPDGRLDVLATDLPQVNGIVMDAAGRLFVAEHRAGGRVIEVDVNGEFPPRVIVAADYGNALDCGVDGRLYLPNVNAGSIWSVDPDRGDLRHEFDAVGMIAAVKFGSDGLLYAVGIETGQITAFDLRSRESRAVCQLQPGIDNIAFSDDDIFVSNAATAQLARLRSTPTGMRIDAETRQSLVHPSGLAFCADGTLLVADRLRIVGVHPRENERSLAQAHTLWNVGQDRRYSPIDVVEASPGVLHLVTSRGDVCVFNVDTSASQVRASFAPQRSAVAIAATPGGAVVALSDGDLAYVNAEGAIVSEVATPLRSAFVVAACADGVAVAGDGGIVILHANDPAVVGLSDVGTVVGLAIDDQYVYAAELEGRRIVAFERRTGVAFTIAEGVPLGSPVERRAAVRPSPMIADGQGAVLIAMDGDGSIRRFTRSENRGQHSSEPGREGA